MAEQETATKRRRERHVTWKHSLWYHVCWSCCWLPLKLLFRVRHRGARHVPRKGPVLVVSNHQSFLDPPAIGIGLWRRMNYLARKQLFTFKPFALLIASVDAIPLDQDGIGFQGIKETIRRLRNNEMVLIFPEGARSYDGKMVPFRKGYINIAVKTGSTTAMGVQFENIGESAGIPIKTLVTVGNPLGGTQAAGGADQIWTYDGHTWTKYYYYKRGATTKWCVAGSTVEIGDDVTIAAGSAFFFVRSTDASGATTIQFSR